MHNHLVNNFYLGNKKALFYNIKQYYELIGENPFLRIPLTFHIKKGFKDEQYKRFIAYYKKRQMAIKKLEKEEQDKK
jgi:tubulin monoglycylase TTLL3/8